MHAFCWSRATLQPNTLCTWPPSSKTMATPPFQNLFDFNPDFLASSAFGFTPPDLGPANTSPRPKPSAASPAARDNALATLDLNITPRQYTKPNSTTPHQFMIPPDSPLASSFYRTPKKPDAIAIADELDLTLDDVLASPFDMGFSEVKHKPPLSASRVHPHANRRFASFLHDNRLENTDFASAAKAKLPHDITLDTGDLQELDRLLSEASSAAKGPPKEPPAAVTISAHTQTTSLADRSSLALAPSAPPRPSLHENTDVFGIGSFDEVFITDADLKKAQEKLPDDEVKTREDTLSELTQSLLTLSEPGEPDEDAVAIFDSHLGHRHSHADPHHDHVAWSSFRSCFRLANDVAVPTRRVVGRPRQGRARWADTADGVTDYWGERVCAGCISGRNGGWIGGARLILNPADLVLTPPGKEDEPARCAEAIRGQMEIRIRRPVEKQTFVEVDSSSRTGEAVENAGRTTPTETNSVVTTTTTSIPLCEAIRPSLIPIPSTSTSSSTSYSSTSARSSSSLSKSCTKTVIPAPKHIIPAKTTTATRSTAAPAMSSVPTATKSMLRKPTTVAAGVSTGTNLGEASRRVLPAPRASLTVGAAPAAVSTKKADSINAAAASRVWTTGLLATRSLRVRNGVSALPTLAAGGSSGAGVGVAAGRGGRMVGDGSPMGKENVGAKRGASASFESSLGMARGHERDELARGSGGKGVGLAVVEVATTNAALVSDMEDDDGGNDGFRLVLSEAKRKRDETIRAAEEEYRDTVERLMSEMQGRKRRRVEVEVKVEEEKEGAVGGAVIASSSTGAVTAADPPLSPLRATAPALAAGMSALASPAPGDPHGECQLCCAEQESRGWYPCSFPNVEPCRLCSTHDVDCYLCISLQYFAHADTVSAEPVQKS
ncbi:hypothetical protein BC936DRAFT_143139 [Jimgerdemannia flammicorona]|uniref:Uncharacterized protein n=1 Tax=Jimgerdemannia flammicorona TaxID=994334 RepID=A0A433DEC2_9FUNG|nr:hypothetical protein BC936DRAFT_143139 [Jimgerdemannia flammicorona]